MPVLAQGLQDRGQADPLQVALQEDAVALLAQQTSKTAVIFVSGEEAIYESVRPCLDAVTDKANYIGEFGLGSKLKFIAKLIGWTQNFDFLFSINPTIPIFQPKKYSMPQQFQV